jgi:hypothetical protein
VLEPDQPNQEATPVGWTKGSKPFYVLDRSTDIDQAEANLRRALFVIVSGAYPVVTPQHVRLVIASNFNIGADTLTVVVTEPEDFIAFLPDCATADRVYNAGAAMHDPGFSVFFQRWTRVAHGLAATLPTFVELEIRGIPAHAWSKSTTQQLLGPLSWVQSVLPVTEARSDLADFRLSAWCRRPDLIPPIVNMFIPEPAAVVQGQPLDKAGITYPISMRVVQSSHAGSGALSSPAVQPDQGHRRRLLTASSTRRWAFDGWSSHKASVARKAGPHGRLCGASPFGDILQGAAYR